jgi:formylglycine-generating enzyme required for sulfatase activity
MAATNRPGDDNEVRPCAFSLHSGGPQSNVEMAVKMPFSVAAMYVGVRSMNCRWLILLLPFALCTHAKLQATLAIPMVEVGNPGNANDGTGFGAVANVYYIGKHEVTNSQYAEFLNAVDPSGTETLGLYVDLMASTANGGILRNDGAPAGTKYSVKTDRGNNPVVFVSWYSALRFANWMHNGQGSGSTEMGAYQLLGGMAIPSNAATITRDPLATFFLPSENEWYKAAYYNGATSTYWDYPTRTNTTPFSDEPPGGDGGSDSSNTANFLNDDSVDNDFDDGFAVTGDPTFSLTENYLTNVGAYANAPGPYGTFDQAGNVAEWTEAFVGMAMTHRSVRGGHWFSGSGDLDAGHQVGRNPADAIFTFGFRLASTAIPEPSPLLLLGVVAFLCGLARGYVNHRNSGVR